MSPSIVFIQLGNVIPHYVGTALYQARLFNECPIYLVGDADALARFDADAKGGVVCVAREGLPLSASHRDYRQHAKLNSDYRDGFWNYVIERFFVLESFMTERTMNDVVHLEGDVMIYDDLRRLGPLLAAHYDSAAVPFDHDARAIAGIMYVKSPDAIAAFTTFVSRFFAATPHSRINDMELLGLFRKSFGRTYLDSLPVIPDTYAPPLRNLRGEEAREPALYSNHVRALGGVFDAAALGQYVGGADPRNLPGRNTVGFINETAMYQLDRYRFALSSDAAGRQVPLMIDRSDTWPILSLHVHSKNLEPFLSRPGRVRPAIPSTPDVSDPRAIDARDIVNGERLQALANVTVTDRDCLAYHTGLNDIPEIRTIVLGGNGAQLIVDGAAQIEQLHAADVLFVYTHLLEAFVRDILSRMTRPFVLISHNSDHKITEKFRPLLEDPRLLHWFAQNATIVHAKLTPLPIGVANRQWPHGDVSVLKDAMRTSAVKAPTVYVNIDPGTNSAHRRRVLEALARRPFTHIGERRPYHRYLEELAGSRFCCSPEGNGTDCHRTWEALYLGSIPLVDRGAWVEAFTDLPIVAVDDWGAVDAAFLDAAWTRLSQRRHDYRKLTLTYWKSAVLGEIRRHL